MAGGTDHHMEGEVTSDKAIGVIDSYPFLVCIRNTPLKSGLKRMKLLQDVFNASPTDFTPVSNLKMESCFILTTLPQKVLSIIDGDNIHGIPLTDQMKITPMTIEDVTSPEWSIPYTTPDSSRRLASHDEWERSIMVGVTPGVVTGTDDDSMLSLAKNIMHDIKKMSKEGSRGRRQLIVSEEGQT